MWTDETIFQISHGNICQKVIRKKDEANDPSCYNHVVSHPSSVMVWRSIAPEGDDNLHFCRDTINAQDYIHLLNINLQPSVQRLFGRKRYLFQHDNPRPHTAKLTQTWLMSKRVPILEWLAANSDLSPIDKYLKNSYEESGPASSPQHTATERLFAVGMRKKFHSAI